jgi:chloramphenicol 3-O-phosphotransferase
MTNTEMIEKLKQAQSLLSDVYHWASTEMSNGLQITPEHTHPEIESLMSCADSCIIEALDHFYDVETDGQPTEQEEWHSFDPDC